MFLFMFAAVLVTCVLVIHISLFKEINDMANKVAWISNTDRNICSETNLPSSLSRSFFASDVLALRQVRAVISSGKYKNILELRISNVIIAA